jgi:hypothetical protein
MVLAYLESSKLEIVRPRKHQRILPSAPVIKLLLMQKFSEGLVCLHPRSELGMLEQFKMMQGVRITFEDKPAESGAITVRMSSVHTG